MKSGTGRKRFRRAMSKFASRPKMEKLVLVLALTAVLGIGSIAVRLISTVSRAVDLPAHLVRLQVVEASGSAEVMSEVIPKLSGYCSGDLEVQIVETENFRTREVPKSFVISRKKDLTAARLLAQRLNLSADDVLFKPLENNRHQVSATLVLGADFDPVSLPTPGEKES